MDSAKREALALRVLEYSSAEQTEVMIYFDNGQLTRFTHNSVHQNVAQHDVTVKVRAITGGRTGVATTNHLDDEDLKAAVARALAMAEHAPVDPDQPQLPQGGTVHPPEGAYMPQTAGATPQLRADMCDAIFSTSESNDLWCAGFVTTGETGVTIANSSGALASFDGTDAAINVKMNGATSSGFAEGHNTDVSALDAQTIAEGSAAKTRDSANPQAVEPGEWTVIMEPAAFGELFTYVADHFSAQSYDEGSSFLSDGLDKQYVSENVTVMDDYAHPLAPGMPFDFEGQPTLRLALIENGVAKNIVTDSYWAKKLNRPNTGHALPAPNPYGPHATHLVISPGSKPAAQLIAETKRGLLITRFWYIRTVDQKKAIATGMTRDGLFLIEDGVVRGGVHNMRFNHSVLDALRNVEFGNSLHRTGSYSYSIVAPAAKITGFMFSSGTSF